MRATEKEKKTNKQTTQQKYMITRNDLIECTEEQQRFIYKKKTNAKPFICL